MNTFFFDDVQYPEGLFGGKDFFNPIIYSTEEREVGVWIDNKPLYQKTFDCGALLNAQTKEISFTEDMEMATIIDAFAMSTNEGYIISIPDVLPNYVAGSVRIYISKTNKKIYIYSQADMRIYDKSYVTLQYTKTTDTAGSGSYNTLGVPNVHYTTDEQVVGTWIDGKPLYQKTVDTGALPNTTLKTVAHNISNISKIVKYEGMALDSTGADVRIMPYVGFNNWSIGLYVDATNISIQTMQNWASDFPQSYVTIQYTKTS